MRVARRRRAERFYACGALEQFRAARSTRTLGISKVRTVTSLLALQLLAACAQATDFSCPNGLTEVSGTVPHPWFDDVPIPSRWCVDQSGRKNGPWWGWDPEAKTVVFRVITIDGEPDGIYEMYFVDGQIAERGNFNRGAKVGEWITYKSDGSIQSRETY